MNRVKLFFAWVGLVVLLGCGNGGGTQFNPNISYGSLTDSRDGKTYRTVTIGSQTWMAENLNYATSSGSWCYGNNTTNCNTYGRLYDWNTAMTACPAGWYLPTDAEWDALIIAVGGKDVAGTKLRSTRGWGKNSNGTDDYGFSALPGGIHCNDDGFNNAGEWGNWWSATTNTRSAHFFSSSYTIKNFGMMTGGGNQGNFKTSGLSVRCVRRN